MLDIKTKLTESSELTEKALKAFFDLMHTNGYNGAYIIEVYKHAYTEYNEIFDSYNKIAKNS